MAIAFLGACIKDVPLDHAGDASAHTDTGTTYIDDFPATGDGDASVRTDTGPIYIDDHPASCTGAATTPDCATQAIAEAICSASTGPCHVCVQTQDSTGRPVQWMAVQDSDACGCATPSTLDDRDASVDAITGGCGTGPACSAGEICAYTTAGCVPPSVPSCQPVPTDGSLQLFCGCDGVTFSTSSGHPTRPYRNDGTCGDLDF